MQVRSSVDFPSHKISSVRSIPMKRSSSVPVQLTKRSHAWLKQRAAYAQEARRFLPTRAALFSLHYVFSFFKQPHTKYLSGRQVCPSAIVNILPNAADRWGTESFAFSHIFSRFRYQKSSFPRDGVFAKRGASLQEVTDGSRIVQNRIKFLFPSSKIAPSSHDFFRNLVIRQHARDLYSIDAKITIFS